ncbi:MAG: hypothetical protein NTW62_00380 [Candidatus Nomurabacteria bacterium]|nr:hypothetical protein [Candidatus Nomurabacteria bacterium]
METIKIEVLEKTADNGIKVPFLKSELYLTEMLGHSIDKKIDMSWKNPQPDGNLYFVKNVDKFLNKKINLDLDYLESGQRVYSGNNPEPLKRIKLEERNFTLNQLVCFIFENLSEDEETKISSEKIAFCFNIREKIILLYEI